MSGEMSVDGLQRLCQAIGNPAYHQVQWNFLRGKAMKIRFAAVIAGALFAASLTMAADGTWTGYIADSKCGAKAAHEGAR